MADEVKNLPPPEQLDKWTARPRPEKKFEGRRRVYFSLLVAGLIGLALFVCSGLSNPFGGVKNAVSIAASTPSGAAPTSIPTLVLSAGQIRPIGSDQGVKDAAITCRLIGDVLHNNVLLPADSMVYVTGWSAARGGVVQFAVGNSPQWFPATSVRCFDDVRKLEKPFHVEYTPTPTVSRRTSSVSSEAPSAPIIRVVTAFPLPTLVQITPTPRPGIYIDSYGCWVISVEGVKAIYVDGRGVSVGTFCGITELKVIR